MEKEKRRIIFPMIFGELFQKGFFDFTIEMDFSGGFGRFSAAHFALLAVCAAACAALCALYCAEGKTVRARLRRAAAFAALGTELLRAALLMAAGKYGVGRLPLHLCAMAAYVCALHAVRGGEFTGQFLYAFCLPGAAAALVFPDWAYYPAAHFMTAAGFVLHTLIVSYVLMQAVAGELRPDIRRAPECLAVMSFIAAFVYAFDLLTDTNYMFLNWPSPGSPLEDFAFLGRPGYILGYIPLLAAAWAALYLPFVRKKSAG